MKLAAIDIGSNSIHLAIMEAAPGQHLRIVDREKEMVRLGAGTLRSHELSDDAIKRAVAVLRRYHRIAQSNHVGRIVATATAAVREARNASEFVDRVRAETGLDVHVLPGVEEARLIALAVSEVTDFAGRRALIVDIGGGSTEAIVTGGGEPELLLSLRLGAVRLTEKFVTTDPISDKELQRLVATVRTDLSRVVREIKEIGYDFVIGTSGTVLDLVSAAVQASSGYSPVEGFSSFSHSVGLDQIKKLNRGLQKMTLRERRRVAGLDRKRADIIIAGGVLLETFLSEVGARSITTCDWSLREGLILNSLSEERITHAHTISDEPEAADVQTRSVLSVARRFNYDARHSHLVARLAARIFDDTRKLHGMGDAELKLLEYAAVLHDIGYHVAHNNHHRHSVYLIKNSEMPGFTATETAVIAAVARYHRGSMPAKKSGSRERREHEDYLLLDRDSRRVVRHLAGILRIADALDRSHRGVVTDVRCGLASNRVTFHVEATGECDLEIWSAERKAGVFSDVFQVGLRFESAVSGLNSNPPAARGGQASRPEGVPGERTSIS
jgi:exopolyphosphatase/guanosine-5'-triphosphate,3'-diphosphate pyrophosphatase